MRSFIIHMRGDTRRQPNARTLLSLLPDAMIVDAVVGRDVMPETPISPGALFRPRYPFPLGAGEVGCFLSHRACWQRIVDDRLDYALIAEDDLAPDPALWPAVMDLVGDHATAGSFIRIPAKSREKPAAVLAENGPARLFVPRIIGLQTVCQVVGRDAAARLLAASETLDRPVDSFLQMHWATGQTVHTILPNGNRELTAELGGSTIQKKSRAGSRLAREISRAWYRAQIALRPQVP